MNLAAMQFTLNVIIFLSNICVAIYVWRSNKEKVTNARFDTLSKRIDDSSKAMDRKLAEIEIKQNSIPGGCPGHQMMETRINGHNDRLGQHKELINILENDLKHLPKNADIEKLHHRIDNVFQQISGVQSEVSKIAGAMPGITHTNEMINEYLLNGGK